MLLWKPARGLSIVRLGTHTTKCSHLRISRHQDPYDQGVLPVDGMVDPEDYEIASKNSRKFKDIFIGLAKNEAERESYTKLWPYQMWRIKGNGTRNSVLFQIHELIRSMANFCPSHSQALVICHVWQVIIVDKSQQRVQDVL